MTACGLCPHQCKLGESGVGFCRARGGEGGKKCLNYGDISAIALDPVEKKPLRRFEPGKMVLSVGSFGCNLACPFCQNHEISMASPGGGRKASPAELARLAETLKSKGNIGLAYTYNEPLVGFEFVRDCAAEIRSRGMKNILVTNGCFNLEPLVVPGRNDQPDEINRLAAFLAELGDIPLHLSRFFPCHRLSGSSTPPETLRKLAEIARSHLKHVYLGNV